jgi:hypothetical protein
MNLLDLLHTKHTNPVTNKHSLLANKYTPTLLCEWMDNKISIDALQAWFLSEDKFLIVNGQSGSGKSSIVNLMCKETKVKPYYTLSNHSRTTSSIIDRYNDIKRLPGVFIIDDFEFFFSNVDHINPKTLISDLSVSEGSMRCIFIVDSSFIAKLKLFTKGMTEIHFDRPSPDSIFVKCKRIIQTEEIPFNSSIDEGYLKNYIIKNNCNVRYIINALNLFKCIEPISSIEETDLYDVYRMCVNEKVDLNKRLKYFELDAGTIPIICHENYIDFNLNDFEYQRISESMSLGDVYHKRIFSNQNDVNIGTYGCLSSLILGKYNKTQRKGSPRFGLIWTKQAAKYQKLKYIDTFCHSMKCAPKDMYSNYIDHLYLQNSLTSSKAWENVHEHFQTTNASILYNIYNAFTTEKCVTKKTFLSKCSRLIAV